MFSLMGSEVAGSVLGSKFTSIVASSVALCPVPKQQAAVGVVPKWAPRYRSIHLRASTSLRSATRNPLPTRRRVGYRVCEQLSVIRLSPSRHRLQCRRG